MRRDSVTLEVANVSWIGEGNEPRQPTLTITVEDEDSTLRDRLFDGDAPLDAGDVDVSFRFQANRDESAGRGVLAVTNRATGEFILEVNTASEDVIEFVSAARRYAEQTDDASRYRTCIVAADETAADFEKRTLLVYSSEGELLRQHSLIPSGVEI